MEQKAILIQYMRIKAETEKEKMKNDLVEKDERINNKKTKKWLLKLFMRVEYIMIMRMIYISNQ